jgi:hypothetical protein
VLSGVIFAQLNIPCFDGDSAAAWHRVASIDGEIHDDLLELSRVRLHATERCAGVKDQLDVFPDQPLEHRRHAGDHGVEIQHLGLEDLLPAERQELPGQPHGSFSRFLDQVDVPAR